jgi:hypothetical protein
VDASELGCPDRPALRLSFFGGEEARAKGRRSRRDGVSFANVSLVSAPGEFGISNSLATGYSTGTDRWRLCFWDGAHAPLLSPNPAEL